MKKQIGTLIALALTASTVAAGCASNASPAPSSNVELAKANTPRSSSSPADAASAAGGINALGFDLERKLAAGSPNTVFSPASISLALAMARAGAHGTTATEMDAVMRSVGSDANAAWLNALDAALASRSGTFKDAEGKDLPVALRIANAPFVQKNLVLAPEYLKALASRFDAGVRLVDYVGDTEGARKQINGWVDGQTEHRIPELLGAGAITPATRLTLVNAIYMKAPWLNAFQASATVTGSFTRADGSKVDVSFMSETESLKYASGTAAGGGWQAVEIPYVGGSLSMTVIVPEDLAAFEASLTSKGFDAVTGALESKEVNLSLPKFGIETKAQLADMLSALGMSTAFDPDKADFSGMTTQEKLFISKVVHQANIDVDEKGTEAAAATAVVMDATAIPAEPVRVNVNRPFLFAVRDVPTGAILFLGRVGDPSIAR